MQIDPQEKRIKDIKEAFDQFDKDNKGVIPTKELLNTFKFLDQDINDEELRQHIALLDPEDSGQIDFANFLKLMVKVLRDDDTLDELMESFRVFDTEKVGTIATAEMRYILMELGDKMGVNEVKDILKEMDPDDSGQCKYEDYVKKKFEDWQAIKAKAAKAKAKKKKK
ncbi:hypothetical protein pb186bvf_019416 [Paramecium bursaria]